jgi:hypothetical protein
MAKEIAEKTQVSWGSLGGKLFADVPFVEGRLWFDPAELHESWTKFMVLYGIKQHASSDLAKVSFSMDAQTKIDLMDAQMRAGDAVTPEAKAEAEKDVTAIRERAKKAKVAWLQVNGAAIRSQLWNMFQAYKVEKVAKERTERESKATAINAAVLAENARLIALATENAAKMGIPVEIAMKLMGITPIEVEAPVPVVDILNDEMLDGNE